MERRGADLRQVNSLTCYLSGGNDRFTCLNDGGAAVDSAEVGPAKLSVSELTKTAAQSLAVYDTVVRGVSQVDVDAASLALWYVVRHYSVFFIGHMHISYNLI